VHLAYIDECGFSPNWKADIVNQPYHVLAAVVFPAKDVPAVSEVVQQRIRAVGLESFPGTLGRGAEIKAKDVDGGVGYWQSHPDHRARVRDAMLCAPSEHGATAFVVVIDKPRHLGKYVTPADPSLLALHYLLERIQMHAEHIEDHTICICDQNRRQEPAVVEVIEELAAKGSLIFYDSKAYGGLVQKHQTFSRILEFHFGQSQNSVGLQIADFFARVTYSWRKKDKDEYYPGWSHIKQTLFRNNDGKLEGFGYKEFP